MQTIENDFISYGAFFFNHFQFSSDTGLSLKFAKTSFEFFQVLAKIDDKATGCFKITA